MNQEQPRPSSDIPSLVVKQAQEASAKLDELIRRKTSVPPPALVAMPKTA